MKPDLFIVVGWYNIIPESILNLAPTYGLHASILPSYRGGSPLVWSIIKGEKYAGITLFKFNNTVDSGPIVDQSRTRIYLKDTISTLYKRVENLGLKLIKKRIPQIINGTALLVNQDERKASLVPQRFPEDGLINWKLNSIGIYNFVRAQTKPYPGAFTKFNNNYINVWKVKIITKAIKKKLLPGDILYVHDKIIVKTYDGLLEITKANLNGKNISNFKLSKILRTKKICKFKS